MRAPIRPPPANRPFAAEKGRVNASGKGAEPGSPTSDDLVSLVCVWTRERDVEVLKEGFQTEDRTDDGRAVAVCLQ